MSTIARVTADLREEFKEDRDHLLEVLRDGGYAFSVTGGILTADFAESDEDERNHSTRDEYQEVLDEQGFIYTVDWVEAP